MSETRRQKRLAQTSKRKPTSLSLTSLMDVFTILVFFLLVNSASDAVIDNPKDFTLPSSISDRNPDNSVELLVGVNEVLLQGRYVMSLDELRLYDGEDDIVPTLRDELVRSQANSRRLFIGELTPENLDKLRSITIIANREISYAEIRKIMASASEAGYGKFSMAVLQTSIDK